MLSNKDLYLCQMQTQKEMDDMDCMDKRDVEMIEDGCCCGAKLEFICHSNIVKGADLVRCSICLRGLYIKSEKNSDSDDL